VNAPAVLVLTCSLDDLRAMMRDEWSAARAADAVATSTSNLVDVRELARNLDVSPATIRRLMAEGAPSVYVGQSPRFDVAEFRTWLDARGRQGTKAAPRRPPPFVAPFAAIRASSVAIGMPSAAILTTSASIASSCAAKPENCGSLGCPSGALVNPTASLAPTAVAIASLSAAKPSHGASRRSRRDSGRAASLLRRSQDGVGIREVDVLAVDRYRRPHTR